MRLSGHGVGLARVSDAIGKEQPILALQELLREGKPHHVKHLRLGGAAIHHPLECVLRLCVCERETEQREVSELVTARAMLATHRVLLTRLEGERSLGGLYLESISLDDGHARLSLVFPERSHSAVHLVRSRGDG